MTDTNLHVLDGTGADVYEKAYGAGSSGDPNILERAISPTKGSGLTLGAALDQAAVDTDAAGTIPQYLRGLVKRIAAKIGITVASGDIADGGVATLGAKADNKSTATDTTAITAMQVLKEISYMLQNPAAGATGSNVLGKYITPTTYKQDSITRPANATAYADTKVINCTVAVTAMAYTLKVVTLTAVNAFAVGDRITVAGVNTGFTVTNIDGNWICGTGTNATTVVFTVDTQPTGTTPQTISVGTIAKLMSFDVTGVAGASVIVTGLNVTLPGVGMTGPIRGYIYRNQVTVLVDQGTFIRAIANAPYFVDVVDLYPVAEAGSDCTFATLPMWRKWTPAVADTRFYFRWLAKGAGTPASGGVMTAELNCIQLLG